MAEGKKNRKIGRNIDACRRYAAEHRAEHNQLRNLKKVVKGNPNDKDAIAAIEKLKSALGMK